MANDMGFKGTCTISIQVSDLAKAAKWYAHHMGCEEVYMVEHMGWGEVTSPVEGVTIGLSQVEKPKTTGAVPVWEVADIDSARATLESQDVRFDGDTMTIPGMVKLATFFDADGNGWMLSQTLNK